jgi:partner of Y14 and mago
MELTVSNFSDPKKKLRNLRKKLRDIQALQNRIFVGDLNYPEPAQFVKLNRKDQIEAEILELETIIGQL